MGPSKCNSVGTDSQDGDPLRSKAADFALKATTAADQFMPSDLSRLGSRTGDDVSEAVSVVEQQLVLPGIENAFCEPARLQRGPEPVSRPREVVPDGS